MKRCPICNTRISESEQAHACPNCLTEYHTVCWAHNEGCAIYGCEAAAAPEKPAQPTVSVSRAWGDEKICPACSQTIPSSLIVCRCGVRFPWADAMTPDEYAEWMKEEEQRTVARRLLVAAFLVSLLGILAPLAGAAAGVYAYRSRKLLSGGMGAYLALGYGAAVNGFVYGLVMLLLKLGA